MADNTIDQYRCGRWAQNNVIYGGNATTPFTDFCQIAGNACTPEGGAAEEAVCLLTLPGQSVYPEEACFSTSCHSGRPVASRAWRPGPAARQDATFGRDGSQHWCDLGANVMRPLCGERAWPLSFGRPHSAAAPSAHNWPQAQPAD